MNSSHFANWYPFRSREVKDIYDHLSPEEEKRIADFRMKFGLRLGLIIGTSFYLVTFVGTRFTWGLPLPQQLIISIPAIVLAGLVIGYFAGRGTRTKAKELFCSTAYAKQKGYSPHTLKLYSF